MISNIKRDLKRWVTLCENAPPLRPIDIADERAADIYTDLGTCERIVWEKDSVIETNELDDVGLGPNVPGVYGVHVTSDIEFWFNQLVEDYGRDPLAYVVEIICLESDVLVEDNQIMDRDAVSASSHVLLTTRKQLILGKDFKFVRTLTEADLEEPEDYDEGQEEYD
jgi:hypothetical protein